MCRSMAKKCSAWHLYCAVLHLGQAIQCSSVSLQHTHDAMLPIAGCSLLGAFPRSLRSAGDLALGGAAVFTSAAGETCPACGPISILDMQETTP